MLLVIRSSLTCKARLLTLTKLAHGRISAEKVSLIPLTRKPYGSGIAKANWLSDFAAVALGSLLPPPSFTSRTVIIISH